MHMWLYGWESIMLAGRFSRMGIPGAVLTLAGGAA
jgi:hypothetical protein